MDKKNLDELFRELGSEPIPDAPGNLESRVLREVRVLADTDRGAVGIPGVRWLSQLHIASAVAVIAVGAGLIFGSVVGGSMAVTAEVTHETSFTFEPFRLEAVELKLFDGKR